MQSSPLSVAWSFQNQLDFHAEICAGVKAALMSTLFLYGFHFPVPGGRGRKRKDTLYGSLACNCAMLPREAKRIIQSSIREQNLHMEALRN